MSHLLLQADFGRSTPISSTALQAHAYVRDTLKSASSWHERGVCYPQLIGLIGNKLTIHQIGRGLLPQVALSCHLVATTAYAPQTVNTHQPCYTAATDGPNLAPSAQLEYVAYHKFHLTQRESYEFPLSAAHSLAHEHSVHVYASHNMHCAKPLEFGTMPDWEVGLIHYHELEDGVNIFSPLAANQAVAFAKISRSICNWRT